ncbi:hypothetical protein EPH_0063170 [Eimeria praecox]|uniref:Uncharacterized protein n=1 Tax=Eimeria praecox TaxID=51316 RepID=U6H7G1_9EIME|nr:hypothetical protein EPH_0063170 [Eimeria praecox]
MFLRRGGPSFLRKMFSDSRAVLGVRKLLKMPFLDEPDLELLMDYLELLVNHALHRTKEDVSGWQPKIAVERLAFALLGIDAIYAASEVLGPHARRSDWWEEQRSWFR